MKTLIILFIVLGIVFLYFIAGAEKSLIVKNDEVTPNGVNIPKLIINKVGEIKSRIAGDGTISGLGSPAFVNDLIDGAKDLISKTVNKISDSVKSPIENKIQEIICPAK